MIKPEIKVTVEWDAYDKLFLDMLLEGYELTYWNMLDTKKDLEEEPEKYSYKNEDYWYDLRILDAFELLASHYTARDDHLPMLKDIRDRLEAKTKIMKGMTQ